MNRLIESIKNTIRNVPDFPREGILFRDLTPVFENGALFSDIIQCFAKRYRDQAIKKVVAVEARGFILGAGLAQALRSGFVLVRKPGKLPHKTIQQSHQLEYGNSALEMHVDNLKARERVVVIDDVLATGGTADAACSLVRQAGAEIVEVAFLLELAQLGGRNKLSSVPIFSLVSD